MRNFLIFVGKVFLLAIVSLLPVFLFAWYQDKIKSKSLRWFISFAAVDLSFFLCSFVGLCLDPRAQNFSLSQRLLVSLLFVITLTLIMIVSLPLRKLASSLFHRFF
jgi:antibiotic biosynthesis monooxygenase (ABM) superfamily enzyme